MICRRSALERQEKKKKLRQSPFLVSDPRTGYRSGQPSHQPPRQTPIVKNYQLVPTTTKEFLHRSDHQLRPHTALDIQDQRKGEGLDRPLLT